MINFMRRGTSLKRLFSTSKRCSVMYYDSHGNPDYLRMILLSHVYGAVEETPLDKANKLSSTLGTNVRLKREDLNPVFSFKLRGAYNMMAQLSPEERSRGVITASAGNHAQGVAFSSSKLGIPATIVMPLGTPEIKWRNVARLGANVVLHGQDFDAAKAECNRLEKENGMTFVPPFDHPYVIAGQGTIGMEIVNQLDVTKLKAVFCAIGGGGLIAGVAVYLKRIAPHVKIIGVESYDADAMKQSLEANKLVTLPTVGMFADGTAVRQVGKETFRVCSKFLDDIVLVNTDEICAAINDVFDETRSICEPSGALSVAGLKKYIQEHPELSGPEDEVSAVVSGANMNFDRLRFVSERSRLGAGKEVFMIVEIPEVPGSFRKLIDIIGQRPVTEFSYRYNRTSENARVYISFSVDDRGEIPPIQSRIESNGLIAYDVSDNNLAKAHARYLVGGTPKLSDEHVYAFEFPERPGALQRFLQGLDLEWNISLFHYRNNGSDVGSVLTGIQVPKGQEQEFQQFLDNLGYKYLNESENYAYKLCLE